MKFFKIPLRFDPGSLKTLKFVLVLMLLFMAGKGQAQEKNEQVSAQIKVAGRALDNKIMLRWAPTEPVAWQLLNKYGYQIDRITLARNGKLLDQPELVNIQSSILKPDPLERWEQAVE